MIEKRRRIGSKRISLNFGDCQLVGQLSHWWDCGSYLDSQGFHGLLVLLEDHHSLAGVRHVDAMNVELFIEASESRVVVHDLCWQAGTFRKEERARSQG